jgi:SAM-dependent methyltransferase
LSEFRGPEFTGERVIPGLVDADLLNEHLSRYLFAKRFIRRTPGPASVLDAGCGSGYGSAELAKTGAAVTGADISGEAVTYARERFGAQGIRFVEAPCESLPFETGAFDLVTAFEVIEHLERWREMLAEANRVLKPGGVLLVSTPNRDYYTESRGEAGPNPFHVHEFDYREFQDALAAVFPHVRIWTQNHAGAIVFSPPAAEGALIEASDATDPAAAHFYLAACSRSPVALNEAFTWTPSSANVLRERERHIARLTGELRQKDAWLQQNIEEHAELQRRHEAVEAELASSNNWAAELTRELEKRASRILALQAELDTRLDWARSLEARIETASAELNRVEEELASQQREAQAAIDRLEAVVIERTAWAQRVETELQQVRSTFWYKAGAVPGFVPRRRDGQ